MEIAPHRGAPAIRLADPVADDVARAHDDAVRVLGVAAGTTIPVGDVGIAAPGLRALVETLRAAAGDLAEVNRGLAAGVRGAARRLGSADEVVGAGLRSSAGALG